MNKKIKALILMTLSIAILSANGCSNRTNSNKNSKDIVTNKSNEKSLVLSQGIHINQLGYRINDRKIVIVNGKGSEFEVVDESTGNSVFKGKLTGSISDAATTDTLIYGDFTEVKVPGKYYINIQGIGKSYSFKIDENVYSEINNSLLKAMYYQRCGMVLDKKYADKWNHEICHTSEATLYEDPNVKLDVSGGWHDAGDYGRYTVPAAKAVADLLLAYDFFPNAFKTKINIPESTDNLPDILNEAKYELDWLFKMQDKSSGGVYTKVATAQFPAMIMPEKDKAPLIIYQISSPATADFSAVMALASRIYKNFDISFSEKCLKASLAAWKWLELNPDGKPFRNPSDAASGEYGDNSDKDERYWASAELFRTTDQDLYHTYFKKAFEKLNNSNSLGWADMGGYGSIAYLFTDRSKTDSVTYEKIKSRFMSQADALLNISTSEGYRVTLKSSQYNWGSNMSVLDNAMHLIIANKLNSKREYMDTAISQWHYILGLNSLNQSFVTGFGAKPIMNPHHRPSADDKVIDPVPGLVSGGPNSGLQDDDAKSDLVGKPPAKCFIDKVGSYSTNEITIYWNSPAIFVSGFLNDK